MNTKAQFAYLPVLAAALVFVGCGQSESTPPTPAPPPPQVPLSQITPKGQQPQASALPAGHPDISGMSTQGLPPGHPGMGAMGALPPGAAADAPNPQWTVPATWTVGAGSAMRKATFEVKGNDGQSAAEVVVSSFPGDVGGLIANVNRWRGQIGLRPIGPDEIAGFTKDWMVGGDKATVVDFKGDKAPAGKTQPQRMVVVTIPHAGNSWFFKLTGDEPGVGDQKEAFLKFVESVKF